MRTFVAALGLAALAGACSQPGGDNRTDDGAAVANEVEAKAPSTPSPAANSASAGRPQAPSVVLAGDGITLLQGDGTRQLPFGTPEREAVRIITAALGPPPVEQGFNRDCGAGPLGYANFRGGLDLIMQDGRFAGWFYDAEGQSLRTMSGIGIGSTRRELDAAYDTRVEESTLGHEFTAGELGGLLSSASSDGRVEALWAGMTCMFR